MPVIWGFDLSEMSWSAFEHKKMFDPRWHLRRERFIVYQLAMLICLAAECTATYSLTKYEDLQTHVEAANGRGAQLHNNDLIAAECLTIVFCVLVATLFGAEFFFLLFFPQRTYPKWYNGTKKSLAVGITLGVFAAALMSSVIVARNSAFITGVDEATKQGLVEFFYRPPLRYNVYSTNIAYVVLLWIGLFCTAASTVIMFIAAKHDAQCGTEPRLSLSEDERHLKEGRNGATT
ncbi:hypothetical protein PILCRDRAFT_185 [Piloderma croceum F 1598]|uniref:MARVEL domain-containing protein n=1 Tax=Piloderma croceum (strain F 1598) TaxID=765440 RepID=A0A0C3BZS8_PILCF|nr:hypothetical protein PILCRDRAFT_185 [Piloderma croceum F 1598]